MWAPKTFANFKNVKISKLFQWQHWYAKEKSDISFGKLSSTPLPRCCDRYFQYLSTNCVHASKIKEIYCAVMHFLKETTQCQSLIFDPPYSKDAKALK